MYIETIELLEFLTKAHKLNICSVDIKKNDYGYRIILRHDWDKSFDYYNKTVFITNDSKTSWDYGDHTFYTMNDLLDKMLEEKEKKQVRAQKRKELIARLTEEEKDLLGIE